MSEQSFKAYSMWVEGKEVAGNAEQSVSKPLVEDTNRLLTLH